MKTKFRGYTAAMTVLMIFTLLFFAVVVLKDHFPQGNNRITWDDDPALNDTARIVLAFAEDHGYEPEAYPDSLVQLLNRNPETKDFVLNYPRDHEKDFPIDMSEYENAEGVPLFMQWDKRWGYTKYGDDLVAMNGCGPVCLAMAGYYWTRSEEFSPDKMVAFAIENGYCVPGNGTSWTLFSEGAVKLGLDVTEIPLDENRINRNLEVGNPIVCIMGPGDFTASGHYIVMTGLEDGLIRVNDPNSHANTEKLWDYDDICGQIRNLWVIRE